MLLQSNEYINEMDRTYGSRYFLYQGHRTYRSPDTLNFGFFVSYCVSNNQLSSRAELAVSVHEYVNFANILSENHE